MKNIVVTRPKSRVNEAVKIIKEHDCKAIIVPTLELELINSPSLQNMISKLDSIDWLIFTSVSSLDSIFKFYSTRMAPMTMMYSFMSYQAAMMPCLMPAIRVLINSI